MFKMFVFFLCEENWPCCCVGIMESGNRLWERNGTIVVPSGGRYRTVLLYDLLPPIYVVGMCLLNCIYKSSFVLDVDFDFYILS